MTKNYIMQRIDDFIFDSNEYLHTPIRVPFQSLTIPSKLIVVESLGDKIGHIQTNFSNTFGVRLTLYRTKELYRELYDILNDEGMRMDNNSDPVPPKQDPCRILTPTEAAVVNQLMGYRNYTHLWKTDGSNKSAWVDSVIDQSMIDIAGIEKIIAAMQYYLVFKHRGIGHPHVDQSRCLTDIGAYQSIIEILKLYLSDKASKCLSEHRRPYKFTLRQINTTNNPTKQNVIFENYIRGFNTSMDAVIVYWKSLNKDRRKEELHRLSLRVINPECYKSANEHLRAIMLYTTLLAIGIEVAE